MKQNNIPLSEYPRPQLQRDSYLSLNGLWQYAIRKDKEIPDVFDGEILVPFSPETTLSGVNKLVSPDDYLFYKRELDFSELKIKDKVIINFLAVDQIAEVFVNNKFVGKHVGGFLPFSFDITEFLEKKNTIVLRVKDTTNSSFYSSGKQSLTPQGIFYPPQSGIYLPVFIESVSNDYIKNLKITPDVDNSLVRINVISETKKATILFENKKYEVNTNEDFELKVSDPHLWSPEDPFLYEFKVKTIGDEVSSYFALRKVSLIKENGKKVIALNNKPYFMKGILDQGYYKQGLLTPKSYDDYIYDINLIKSLGFNTARKHIKIEAPLWYYYCDKLGLIVWQDFVNACSKFSFFLNQVPLFIPYKISDHKYKTFGRESEEGRKQSLQEFRDTINYLYNVPSICVWTIFNEGWGQFDSKDIYFEMKSLDKTRLFDSTSGWHDQGYSDFLSKHVYLKKIKAPISFKNRAYIVSECGAFILDEVDGTRNKKGIAYTGTSSQESFENMYINLITKEVIPAYKKGMSAFIYTQVSDVEDEKNGFVTYDRKKVKVNITKIKNVNDSIKK